MNKATCVEVRRRGHFLTMETVFIEHKHTHTACSAGINHSQSGWDQQQVIMRMRAVQLTLSLFAHPLQKIDYKICLQVKSRVYIFLWRNEKMQFNNEVTYSAIFAQQ